MKLSARSRSLFAVVIAFAIAIAAPMLASCGKYVAPPVATIDGEHDGVLDDPAAPIVLRFSKPVDRATLALKIIAFAPDANGKLADEAGDPTVDLAPFYTLDSTDGDRGGTSSFDDAATTLTIQLKARLPVGPKLAVLIEPGLAAASHDDSAVTAVRKRILFTYSFKCTGTGTKVLPSGAYFFLLDVEEPIGTQIRLFADMQVDAATGLVRGQFTRAGRIADPNRCSPACTDGKVCQTLPGPQQCVVPSTRAGTTDEFPDFYPDPTPPVGFSFTIGGCAEDQSATSAAFATEPSNMVVQQPPVSVNGLVVISSFARDASNVLRATGGITGDDIVFGTSHLGAGHGTVAARLLSPEATPPGIPPPPAPASK